MAARRNITDPHVDQVNEQVLGEIVKRFDAAKKPVILADLYAERYGLRSVVRELVARTGVKAFCCA